MTLGTMQQQVYERMPDAVANEKIDDGIVLQALNHGLQNTFQKAVAAMPDFYARHGNTFTNQTAVALPSDYYDILLVDVPTATRGAARKLRHRDVETMALNVVSRGTATDPTYVVDKGFIHLSPATTGSLWYTFKFGFISDPTREITEIDQTGTVLALIPAVFEEDVILEAIEYLRARYEPDDAAEDSMVESQLQAFLTSTGIQEQQREPEEVYARQTTL